jgi:hypothetical protein
MQLAGVVVPSISVSVLFSLSCIWSVGYRWGYRKLCSDLLERCLGVRQSKLMAEEEGFRGIAVRCRDVQRLHRINERLCLLHKAGEVEHGSWYLLR